MKTIIMAAMTILTTTTTAQQGPHILTSEASSCVGTPTLSAENLEPIEGWQELSYGPYKWLTRSDPVSRPVRFTLFPVAPDARGAFVLTFGTKIHDPMPGSGCILVGEVLFTHPFPGPGPAYGWEHLGITRYPASATSIDATVNVPFMAALVGSQFRMCAAVRASNPLGWTLSNHIRVTIQ